MSDCCTPNNVQSQADDCCAVPTVAAPATPAVATVQNCPSCGKKGKTVDTQTVKAMLAVSLEVLRPIEYRFCRTQDCPVVYFASDGAQVFHESDLRETVHQKHPLDGDVFVCYCFRHTPSTIRAELLSSGESMAIEQIKAGIKAEQCACEIRNPQGSCCLGNVTKTVKRVKQEQAAVLA